MSQLTSGYSLGNTTDNDFLNSPEDDDPSPENVPIQTANAEFDDAINLEEVDRICCIGAGRVGIMSMAVLSRFWLGKTFVVLDKDEDIINNINGQNEQNQRELYFVEPGLDELLDQAMLINQNLIFSSDIAGELDNCRVIFVAVDIPLKSQPSQVKGDFDVENLENAIVAIVRSIQRAPVLQSKYVAIKSTLPVDYKRDLCDRLARHLYFDYLHITTNPEFFSDGTAVEDLLYPHKIVFGNFWEDGQHIFRDLYLPVVEGNENRIEMINTIASTELGKLLSNASIAAQLTMMNIGSTICEKVNANFEDVKRTFVANSRVDAFFTDSRPGYGGLGLNKDVSYLAFLCESAGLRNEMDFFKRLIQMRKKKMDDLVRTILSKVGSSKRIAIYGFANKIDTDNIRESPAIYICNALLQVRSIRLVIYDPLVPDENIMSSFPDRVKNRITVVANAEAARVNAHALIFLLEWPDFRQMFDVPQQLMLPMRSPRIIFDCCDLLDNAFNLDSLQAVHPGATVYRLGKPI